MTDVITGKGECVTLQFVSRDARMKGLLEGENVILGPSSVGSKSFIGLNVIIGYPTRKKIQAFFPSKDFTIEKFNTTSSGAKIGGNCIIRSGTVIYEDVIMGDWVETGHNVLIREGSTIDDRTRIGTSTKLDGAVKIGKNVSIQSNVYLPHLTTIEDEVFLGPSVVLTNDPYPPSERRTGILVKKGAAIGANACIIAPANIGANSVVGAGALVTKDVPPNMVVFGAPAQPYITKKEYDRKRAEWEKGDK